MNKEIKHALKKIPGASYLGYKYLELSGGLRTLKNRRVETQPDRILFVTTGGKYHDSCKAIAERIHQVSPETDIVWAYRNPNTISELPQTRETGEVPFRGVLPGDCGLQCLGV